ncbi:MAG: cupin domain-containing protein [Thermodesulfobacteriota bacterium]
MKVVRLNEVAKIPVTSPLFTGKEVTRQILVSDSPEFDVTVVNFGRGVRNKFHAHDSDQVLIVTAGKGIIATADEEIPITVGDVVLIPAQEKHWHGATETSEFSHIYLTRKSSKLTQLED